MSDVLEIETDGHLRVLRLNRPDRKNALTGELIQAIVTGLRHAAHDDDVWAVAVTGNGDAFCSGLDLAGMSSGDDDEDRDEDRGDADDDRERDHFTMVARYECEKPVLAGVNGVAVGMGVSLAMCADIRIAAPSARFHPGYARVGASPDGGLTWTLPEAVGRERALRFFFEQRMIGAADALELGMVGEVTASDDAFADRFLEYGRMLAAVAPIAAQQTKRLVGAVARPPELQAHLTEEIRLTLSAFTTDDSREAVRAMAAREQPTFTGR
jgi:2-(1,2-epoxy-1,2-dihydrophenyl)acetyl-CoA isomerase